MKKYVSLRLISGRLISRSKVSVQFVKILSDLSKPFLIHLYLVKIFQDFAWFVKKEIKIHQDFVRFCQILSRFFEINLLSSFLTCQDFLWFVTTCEGFFWLVKICSWLVRNFSWSANIFLDYSKFSWFLRILSGLPRLFSWFVKIFLICLDFVWFVKIFLYFVVYDFFISVLILVVRSWKLTNLMNFHGNGWFSIRPVFSSPRSASEASGASGSLQINQRSCGD